MGEVTVDPHLGELRGSIRVCRSALDSAEPIGNRADLLKALADALSEEYQGSHSVDLIEEAIAVYEEVLGLRPPHDQQRAQAVNDLAGVLEQFCVHHGEGRPWVRGQRCIGLLRESLELRPPGHSLRDQSLHSLGRAIGLVKHKETEDRVQRVMTCVDLNREALQLRPLGHPDREKSLTNLGLGLRDLFDFTRDQNVLEEAILIQRQVLEVCAPGHPLRHNALNNLAICLRTWFEHRGGIDRLAEAIRLLREALLLRPSGHPMRYMTLDNLSWAIGLSATIPDRAEQFQESISVEREALRILPEDHAQRARIQGNLAHCLMRAFRHGFTSSEVVSEAVALRREALEYATLRCLTVHSVMGGLADALAARFDLHKVEDDFLEALSLKRQSLKLCPARDWRRSEIMLELASLLCKPECALWSEALLLFREALELMPSGFPNRAPLLSDMSRCFLEPSSEFFDFTQGMALISEAHLDQFCPVYVRLKSAVFNLRQIEEAYSVITCCLRDIEGDDMEIQVLELYIEVINLLPRVANFGLDHNARLQAITGSDEIVRNAAARALHLGRIPHAVEMLEEGRGVFWSQTLRLRTTGFDGVPDKDRQDLERLLQMLDFSTRRDQSSEMSVTQREKDLEERRQLNEQAEALITTIRGYPGLARFLMPAAFADLVSALPDGYIVILNSSSLGHHALLLNGARGLATSFELQASYRDFDSETIRSQVDRNILREANSEPLWEGTRAMKVSGRRLKSLDDTLTLLWDSIVRPVLNELSIEKDTERARPRLWWCVTGQLSFLPIHAAGDYRVHGGDCTSDYVVSSYVPTLTSLSRSRKNWQPLPRTGITGLIVCEPSAPGMSQLSEVTEEVRLVRECFQAAQASVIDTPSLPLYPHELTELLSNTPAHILHLACHGVQDPDPLKSAFLLREGRFTIGDIMQLDMSHALLAFLSACHTAKGDRNAPDQAVHLAASMLFCGFKSIIGTMWSLNDADGPKIAHTVYDTLFKKDHLDLDDVPYAIDDAVQNLRSTGVESSRWALFMHMGG